MLLALITHASIKDTQKARLISISARQQCSVVYKLIHFPGKITTRRTSIHTSHSVQALNETSTTPSQKIFTMLRLKYNCSKG